MVRKKKAQLSLVKTRYSLYSSRCSTDLQGHPRSMIFMSSERVYAISINSNLGPISHRLATVHPLRTDGRTHDNPYTVDALQRSCSASVNRIFGYGGLEWL